MEQIDTSTTEGKIAVMQAFLDGKKIKATHIETGNHIYFLQIPDNPKWAWDTINYTIVKEPKKVWSVVLDERNSEIYMNRAAADRRAAILRSYGINVVIEEFVQVVSD